MDYFEEFFSHFQENILILISLVSGAAIWAEVLSVVGQGLAIIVMMLTIEKLWYKRRNRSKIKE